MKIQREKDATGKVGAHRIELWKKERRKKQKSQKST